MLRDESYLVGTYETGYPCWIFRLLVYFVSLENFHIRPKTRYEKFVFGVPNLRT